VAVFDPVNMRIVEVLDIKTHLFAERPVDDITALGLSGAEFPPDKE
jgi:hypothetical protein